jgi:hypothetical protein
MTLDTDNPQPEASVEECPTCKLRRDKWQAIGLSVFMVSLFSCGTLTFIAVPTGAVIQVWSLRSCKTCRQKKRRKQASEPPTTNEEIQAEADVPI